MIMAMGRICPENYFFHMSNWWFFLMFFCVAKMYKEQLHFFTHPWQVKPNYICCLQIAMMHYEIQHFSWTLFLQGIHNTLVLISLLYLKQKCQLWKNCFASFFLAKIYGAQLEFFYTPLASNTQAHFVSAECNDALWNPTVWWIHVL